MSKYDEINERITNRLIADLEAGVAGNWSPSWATESVGLPINAVTGSAYSGGNVLVLWVTGIDNGWTSGLWATYKQWEAIGAQVRKGERGTGAVKWITADKARRKNDGEDVKRSAFPSAFTLFAAEQVDGFELPVKVERSKVETIEHAEAFFAATGSKVVVGEPAYWPSKDVISLPAIDAFDSAESYYATAAHEHVHWSGAKERLGRDLKGRFGDSDYAVEELVAELGAAFITAHLGIAPEPRQQTAAYLAHWLKVLKADPKALYTAASHASKALAYLAGFSATQHEEVAA